MKNSLDAVSKPAGVPEMTTEELRRRVGEAVRKLTEAEQVILVEELLSCADNPEPESLDSACKCNV